MIENVTPELVARLFPEPPSDGIVLTPPLTIDPALEATGIDFGGTRFVVFFADVLVYAGGDQALLEQTAQSWHVGMVPAPGARLVKFLRIEADKESMFNPKAWPLPDPEMIWQFMDILSEALVRHAETFPDVPQYFYMPQCKELDSLYNRMSRRFDVHAKTRVAFHCVAQPADEEGGFYGFERI
ncbi:hypothetical protein [Paraburkholderia bannensis]|uniref:hypothetical protein n=1 Tax=Paraburkholderia bannensis TaxID=765414 RepID=UPI000489E790|nr:hypothetical protein [Paraburkholderia bannensis]